MALLQPETIEQKKARARAQTVAKVYAFKKLIQDRFTDIMRDAWLNPELTPQQYFDALGPDGVKLFQFAGALQEMMNTIDPGSLIVSAQKKYQITETGRVVITE